MDNNRGAQVTLRLRPSSQKTARQEPPTIGELPSALSPAARTLCLAIYFDDLLRRGEVQNHADIARKFCVSRERVSQIMKLQFLAPQLQIGIISGAEMLTEVEARQVAEEITWREQADLDTP